MWSVVEKTALAEAEVEYHDVTSDTLYVRFPIVRHNVDGLPDGASILIWTTTPWTIPANRALAYGEDVTYAAYRVTGVGEGATVAPGEVLVIAEELRDAVATVSRITDWEEVCRLPGTALAGTICRHPLHGQGYDADRPLLAGHFVTTEMGTGFVHIAPSHGADDYELGVANGFEPEETVDEDGRYTALVPLFEGLETYTSTGKKGRANKAVTEALAAAGGLAARDKLVHSYPHSWRSKAPVIFRATGQWFISMDRSNLRDTALKAIDDTRFYPQAGQTRLRSMIEQRPDWCISRQRAWGVPIAIFVDKRTGEPLRDPAVLDRIATTFDAEGSDAWYARDPQDFLGNAHDASQFEQVFDIVDVWFESGSTHAFVLEQRDELMWPASLYLEGSDQHRGWFHSSLLESCGTRGRAPYDAVLTHGFTLDEKGHKMSKALGNGIDPDEVYEKSGADILRLWIAGADYSEDMRFGPEILKTTTDTYRRLRNTLRYLLGALEGFGPDERVDAAEMPELERWVLHKIWEMDQLVRRNTDGFDFTAIMTALHNFCAVDLSAFYFDIRKDALYCDRPDSLRRRAARTVFDTLYDALTAWLAPVICFTAEEAWLRRHGDDADSVHERVYPAIPDGWRDDALADRWAKVRAVRRVVTGAIEPLRAAKEMRSSLEAHPRVFLDPAEAADLAGAVRAAAGDNDVEAAFADVCITSQLTLIDGPAPDDAVALAEVPGVGVIIDRAEGSKCERSWKILPSVGNDPRYPTLSPRDADAVDDYLRRHGQETP